MRALALMGPTAVGKTDYAVELVRRWPFEIISVDSAMIYRGMDIGSATPEPDILAIAPHRMINILDPAETFSAYAFAQQARAHMTQIYKAGRIPLLVGGSRLYFLALIRGLSPIPDPEAKIRRNLRQTIKKQGIQFLYKRLSQCDPATAHRLKPTDSQRILRALEVYESSGRPLSFWHGLAPSATRQGVEYLQLALWPEDRSRLHQQINQRFDNMLGNGLIEETQALHARDDLNLECSAMRCVGYRQVWRYLEGECNREQMRVQAQAATRQLAKRQMTWLRNSQNISNISAGMRGRDRLITAVGKWLRQ